MHDINFRLLKQQDQAKAHMERFLLWPRQWRTFKRTFTGQLSWQSFRMTKSAARSVPSVAGVYSLVVEPGIAGHPQCAFLMYVGMTGKQTLQERFLQYLGPEQGPRGRPHIIRLLSLYRTNLIFCCSAVPAGMTPQEVEDALLAAYIPPYCRDLPAEVSRIIRGIR